MSFICYIQESLLLAIYLFLLFLFFFLVIAKPSKELTALPSVKPTSECTTNASPICNKEGENVQSKRESPEFILRHTSYCSSVFFFFFFIQQPTLQKQQQLNQQSNQQVSVELHLLSNLQTMSNFSSVVNFILN